MKKYTELLNIDINGGKIPLFTSFPNTIARSYQRVVIGQRGPYVEFCKNEILEKELYIPKSQLYRLSDPKVYYIEFRTIDNDIKVYYQMRSVAYADYRIGYFYISPSNLYTETGPCIRQTPSSDIPEEFFEIV